MPTIEISKKDICDLIGKKASTEELGELLSFCKAEIESAEEDVLKVEVADVNRPDLWSAEGLAREIKAKIGREKGVPKYKISENGKYSINVDPKLKNIRPLIVCAVVKNLKLNDNAIKQIIQLQEKLCELFGRKRKEAALGIYDFDKVAWPISYKTVAPDGIKFIPLEFSEPMTPRQILQRHEKGKEYSHLISEFKEYPLLIDSAGNVLSMPPIINSEHTGKVTEKTKNVFIEVTGYDMRFIEPVLNVIVCALAERGGEIEKVTIKPSNLVTPNLSEKRIEVKTEEINSIIGEEIKKEEILKLLGMARYDVVFEKTFNCKYMPYRRDIMDTRDVIEDIAINYGYNKFRIQPLNLATKGKNSEEYRLSRKVANFATGLRAQEIATFTLTSKEKLLKNMRLSLAEKVVEIANPASENYSCLRNRLLPSVMEFLSKNKDSRFPQRIFEVGKCIKIDGKKAQDRLRICFAISDAKTNFTEIRQAAEFLLRQLNIKDIKVIKVQNESLIEGRGGKIMADNKEIGFLGEIHPTILENWGLSMPVSALEIDLTEMI